MTRIIKKFLPVLLAAMYITLACSSALAIERVNILPATTNQKAPKSNIFQIKGSPDKFILLDATDEGYFVLTEKYCAAKPVSVNGDPVAFDPEDKNSIAYWLNHDYLEDTSLAKRLPQVIIDNIVERTYTTEGGGSSVPFSAQYTSVCKVVLLSQTEWSQYNAKYGYGDDTSSANWALRTVRERTGEPLVAPSSGSNAGLTVDGKWTSSLGIRPAFYLSKDFFEKVSLNIENTGDTVMSIVRKGYEVAELRQIYNSNELYTLTEVDIAPVADSVVIEGRGIVGEKITGKYSFVSLDNNIESGTMIQWQKSKDKTVWSTILGAETKDYVPSENEIGYYVRMKVSPMTGSMAGSSYTSVPLSCTIRAISKPQASDIRILKNGIARPGTILDVKYSFSDENRDICSGTDYTWEVALKNSTDGTPDMSSAQVVSQKRNYKISNKDGGKLIRVGVLPKKQTNSASGRVTVAAEEIAYSEWMEIQNLPISSDVTITRNMDVALNISKTQDKVTISSILAPGGSNGEEQISAVYGVDGEGDYTVVCEWQGSDSKDGLYSAINHNTNTLSYLPKKAMWLRAKVYAKNADYVGKPVYSEPIFLGKDSDQNEQGESEISQKLTSGKTYQIWLCADSENIIAYSFKFEGNMPVLSSEKYLSQMTTASDGSYMIGASISADYSGENCAMIGEITPDKDLDIKISNVLTTSGSITQEAAPMSAAKVFITEK